MIELRDKDTEELFGTITEDQLAFLVDHLEETDDDDQDYFIDLDTVEMLAEEGADGDLVDLLREAVGSGDGVEVRWARADRIR